MMFQKGDLVRVIKAPDQDQYAMKDIINKLGVIVGKVEDAPSSNNIWKVFVGERVQKCRYRTQHCRRRVSD